MASSPLLPSIVQAPNAGLVGYVAAYYLPQEDLLAEPLMLGGLIAADLQLAEGAGWRALPYTQGTLKLDEQPKAERGSTTYQVRVSAQRPQPTAEVLAALAALDRRPLLLLLLEAGGGRRLIGTKEEYVQLLTSGEGQNPATKAGLELRFEGAATRLAPYYQGAVPVLGAPDLPLPGAATGPSGDGYVRVVDTSGKLLATIPAGHTLTIASWFKVILSFN